MDPHYSEFVEEMKKIRRITYQENRKAANVWKELREDWFEHYETIPEEVMRQKNQLLMAVRFTEAFQGLLWIEFLSVSGGYFQALRELRNIIESVVQAYYVDSEYPRLDVDGKLAVLREMRKSRSHYGGRLIDKANPPGKREIKGLYGELSEYVHPTYESIHEVLSSPDSDELIVELLQPEYSAQLFAKCCDLTSRVLKAVISLNQDLVGYLQEST